MVERDPPSKKPWNFFLVWGGWKANKKKKTPPTFQKRNAPVALGNVALLFCFCIIKVCVVLLLLLVHYNMFLFCFISSRDREKCVWGVSHSAATGVVTIGRAVCLLTRADMARNYFRLKRSKTIDINVTSIIREGGGPVVCREREAKDRIATLVPDATARGAPVKPISFFFFLSCCAGTK